MAKKIKVCGCPCCGTSAFWCKGDKQTRMLDFTECSNCGLRVEGDYEPQSSLELWNTRVMDHYVENCYYNIDGEKC